MHEIVKAYITKRKKGTGHNSGERPERLSFALTATFCGPPCSTVLRTTPREAVRGSTAVSQGHIFGCASPNKTRQGAASSASPEWTLAGNFASHHPAPSELE
jgi:hypothetical protein